MPQIVLQPCSDPQAQRNLKKTMLRSVPTQEILEHATDMDVKHRSYFEGRSSVTIWGVKEKLGRPKLQWERMKRGDLVLFYASGNFILVGTIDYKFTSPSLAHHLWPEEGTPPEFSYKFLYVVKNAVPLFTDSSKGLTGGINSAGLFRKAQVAGLRDDGVVMGITVVDEDGSQRLLAHSPVLQNYLQQFTGKKAPEIDLSDPKLTDQFDGLLSTSLLEAGDVLRLAKFRIEQGKLRASMLQGRDILACCICGEEYPATSITTAHIKKRSLCSPSEMRDINVVAPMCYLGCDHLFEHGYVVVDAHGKVRQNRQTAATGLSARIVALDGLDCLGITAGNANYYAWHRTFHTPTT
ncbi:hypothetical protein [Deinococcus maricopensis]|uniref:EVE domain-containing protein n=1 Tax=Deinococcus maricopensis (strain DSM 21211 / LMG 22137 / NRRL B-23946 / LB-34) TaxID=709986 RepID=E8U503_DEIML|nr:hypothetical protein [Deinococcus maricopensis]ADV66142.1 hypothetical protein Deima_0482 [Deinococcus maricopensis DSM 21211]